MKEPKFGVGDHVEFTKGVYRIGFVAGIDEDPCAVSGYWYTVQCWDGTHKITEGFDLKKINDEGVGKRYTTSNM